MPRLYGELRGLMVSNDYTQAQLARKLHISTRLMSNKFNGHVPFTVDEAYEIMKLFSQPCTQLHVVFPPDGLKHKAIVE